MEFLLSSREGKTIRFSSVHLIISDDIGLQNVVENIETSQIKGIGFDATCSLVVLGANHEPISVSPTGNDQQNIIMWMDHRAAQETETINKTQHSVLKFVGGKVSLEMQLPKLLWLKTNSPQAWSKAKAFFDLPDYLTWRATGSEAR